MSNKRLDHLPPIRSHVFEAHAKIIVDLLLARVRQKSGKSKFSRFLVKPPKGQSWHDSCLEYLNHDE